MGISILRSQAIGFAACVALGALNVSSVWAEKASPTHRHGPAESSDHGKTFGGSGVPTILSKVTSKGDAPLAVNQTTSMVLHLTNPDGKPVIAAKDLDEVHTERIHLLIVDASLGDYHHLHPPAGSEPGSYLFDFTPRRPGTYHVFADLHPTATGIQEYSHTTIQVPGQSMPVQQLTERKVVAYGYTFELEFEEPNLVQGKSSGATVRVSGPDGKPFNGLEPVMGAFAHMVGFSEDLQYVAHIHPLGREPQKSEERGGPELKFHVGINYPGYHVLYVQVQIGGKDVFAPFGVTVAPRQLPSDAAGIMKEADEAAERLSTAVHLGPLHKVHDLAFAVRDLVLALPDRTKDLPEPAKANLAQSTQRIRSLASLLDKYGDSGQQKEAQAVLPRYLDELEKVHGIVGTTSTRPGRTEILGNTLCPVSGAKVGSMQAGSSLIYKGLKIGLCCDGCTASFNSDPEAGLKKARESVAK